MWDRVEQDVRSCNCTFTESSPMSSASSNYEDKTNAASSLRTTTTLWDTGCQTPRMLRGRRSGNECLTKCQPPSSSQTTPDDFRPHTMPDLRKPNRIRYHQ